MKNLQFYWSSRAALDSLAGHMFETPVMKETAAHKLKKL
jgi:hypothetical protein